MNGQQETHGEKPLPAAAFLAALAVLLLSGVARAAEKPDEAKVARLIEGLGADSYKVRQQAQRDLIAIGRPAIPQLESALKSPDAEVRSRAEGALAEIRKGAFARASEAVGKRLLWAVPAGGRAVAPPAVAGGKVLLLDAGGKITAFDARTGKAAWDVAAGAQAGLLVAGATAYVADKQGSLQAVDVATGKGRAGFAGRKVAGRPAISNGTLYVAGGTESFLALDARTGEKKWEAQVVIDAGQSSEAMRVRPVVVGDVVLLATGAGGLRALDARTGKTQWKTSLGKEEILSLARHQAAILARSGTHLHGLDARTGKALWRRVLPAGAAAGGAKFQVRQQIVVNGRKVVSWHGARADACLAVADGVVAVTAGDRLVCVDAGTGAQKWTWRPEPKKAPGQNPAGGMVFVQGGAQVQVRMVVGGGILNLTPGGALSGPAVAGGVIYVGEREGLCALDGKTRQKLWRCKTPHPLAARPVVADGVIYFLTASVRAQARLMVLNQPGGQAGQADAGGALHALRLKKAK